MATEESLTFRKREFRGSRFRCLLATSQSRTQVARFFDDLTPSEVSVSETHQWSPNGFAEPAEAKLAETVGLLSDGNRKVLESWWLAEPGRANTPNWDLVSQCDYAGTDGLILIEAKAHHVEFTKKHDTCGAGPDNLNRIQEALSESNDAWNAIIPGFSLSADSKFQLCNRFAFAWKVASLGIPVVLIYLGFLNASDMSDYKLLKSHEDWESCVTTGGESHVPASVWNMTFYINETPLAVLIRSATVSYRVETHAAMQIQMADQDAEIEPVPTSGGGHKPEPELDKLSNILKAFNDQFGKIPWTDADRIHKLITEEIPAMVAIDTAYQNAKKQGDKSKARIEHDAALLRVMVSLLKDDTELFKQFSDNEGFKRWLADSVFGLTYEEDAA